MLTPKQMSYFTEKRREEIRASRLFIPRNRFDVPSGYYRDGDVVDFLRANPDKERGILFLAKRVAEGRSLGA